MQLYQCNEIINKEIKINERFTVKSYEGLCIYCYSHWIEALESDFINAEFITYLSFLQRKGVIMSVENVKEVNSICDKKEVLTLLVKSSILYSTSEKEIYEQKLENYSDLNSSCQAKEKGDYYYNHKKYQEAIYWYERGSSDDDYIVSNNLGVSYYKLHQKEEAIKYLNKAFKMKKDVKVLKNLISLYKKYNMYNEALSLIFANFNAINSKYLYKECGEMYSELGEYDNALTSLYQAYEVDRSIDDLLLIIDAAIKMADYELALKECENLKMLDVFKYRLKKASVLTKIEQYDEAKDILELALEEASSRDHIYLELARICRIQGNIIKAITYINSVVDQNKDYVKYEMACIAKVAGNYKDYNEKLDDLLAKWKKDVRNNYKRNG